MGSSTGVDECEVGVVGRHQWSTAHPNEDLRTRVVATSLTTRVSQGQVPVRGTTTKVTNLYLSQGAVAASCKDEWSNEADKKKTMKDEEIDGVHFA